MHEQPDAAALLCIARQTMQQDILPLLPAGCRKDGLMVLRAIAIAEREISAGPGWAEALQARLAVLVEDSAPMRRLAVEIRAGRYDPGTVNATKIEAFLWDLAKQRCAISNPKALQNLR